jgi:hypothetical protein
MDDDCCSVCFSRDNICIYCDGKCSRPLWMYSDAKIYCDMCLSDVDYKLELMTTRLLKCFYQKSKNEKKKRYEPYYIGRRRFN